ncbi:hypothetical protein CDL12_15861 [Handroanthus impetiginosus]|uniref:Uncharacterized protein n=1 Tax=Handroanthus impetiginosus TaxID=429701 RepID=A0A2G9H205_9LAMI|nr:hypothetical protein CDL12_15861 [Handroanthus impetiginosus]
MGIKAENRTGVPVTVKDYYVLDPRRNTGYYGVIEYCLPPGGVTVLSHSKFVRKWKADLRPQQIHVCVDENTATSISPLRLHWDDFKNNKKVVFSMTDARVLAASFPPKG